MNQCVSKMEIISAFMDSSYSVPRKCDSGEPEPGYNFQLENYEIVRIFLCF